MVLLPSVFSLLSSFPQQPSTPDKIFGELFHEVQMKKIFPDGKTFVDCIPKRKPSEIVNDFNRLKGENLNLRKFVEENFQLPENPADNYHSDASEDVVTHIKNLWRVLRREPDKYIEGSSLLPLPNPYIVPGGRFREIYYWDSYFTMLGLRESGETEMMENMVKNFAYLIDKYGHIPNGNRSYYLSRSQPPFFSLMVEMLAEVKGKSVYKQYLPALEKEYEYWMKTGAQSPEIGKPVNYVVRLEDKMFVNRYWDYNPAPRQESYREDVETANVAVNDFIMVTLFKDAAQQKKATDAIRIKMYHHLRSGATSGWDFSSRWFADGQNISKLHTTDFLPIDLNCLLLNLERLLAKLYKENGQTSKASVCQYRSIQRIRLLNTYCWDKKKNFFYDYDFVNKKRSDIETLASMYPLFFKAASKEQAQKVADKIKKDFVKAGGVTTTINNTGQQWDAPNGWAPLQWMTIKGLENYGYHALAKDIAERWIQLNIKVYKQTGKLMEKYDVYNIDKEAGGGEYPSQDGFGWTNGVLLKLIKMYK